MLGSTPLALRPIPRTLAYVAAIVLILHVITILSLGTDPAGSVIGNGLQIFSSLLAAYFCVKAARKEAGFTRSFWTLIAFSMAIWGIADFGWAYIELVRHEVPAPGSVIRFLFDTHGMFFVMAVFLNQEKRSWDSSWKSFWISRRSASCSFSFILGCITYRRSIWTRNWR